MFFKTQSMFLPWVSLGLQKRPAVKSLQISLSSYSGPLTRSWRTRNKSRGGAVKAEREDCDDGDDDEDEKQEGIQERVKIRTLKREPGTDPPPPPKKNKKNIFFLKT